MPVPSYSYVAQHGPMLRQLGATKIETPGPFDIKLTYTNNSDAVTARAAFNDIMWGARLVIDNRSVTKDLPTATATSVANLLARVPGVTANVAESYPRQLMVSSASEQVVDGLRKLLRTEMNVSDGTLITSVALRSDGLRTAPRPGVPG